MEPKRRRKIFRWIKIVALAYIIIGTALYFLQDKFLFHPEKLDSTHQFTFPGPFTEINLPVTEDKNLSIVQFTVPDSLRKGVVLYFHGNRRNIERYAGFATNFTSNQYEVWMLDYPGFGKSTGERSESIMYSDAELLYKLARSRFGKDSIIVYGKSMGTGPASYVASRRDCKRLILETPYYSIDALMRHYAFIYPVSIMANYHFPVNEYIQRVDAPVTILHGTNDGIIPFKQAKWLLEKAKPGTELVTIQKGKHNNLNDFPLFHHKLDSLLSAQ